MSAFVVCDRCKARYQTAAEAWACIERHRAGVKKPSKQSGRIAALEAENARLKAEVAELEESDKEWVTVCNNYDRNERSLRKKLDEAGDLLRDWYNGSFDGKGPFPGVQKDTAIFMGFTYPPLTALPAPDAARRYARALTVSVVFCMKVDHQKAPQIESIQGQIAHQFGAAVRARREELHMSQYELAELADVASSLLVNDIEFGRADPHRLRLDLLFRFARALMVHPAQLLPVIEVER